VTPERQVDYILGDCFFAVGQAIGTAKTLDPDALTWWRDRYRTAFLHALTVTGNSWLRDRSRVTAVGRFLGQRALHHAGIQPNIDVRCAELATREVDAGCRMSASRESGLPS